ncbi:MAG: MFS transporter [Actinomycetales bacterium]|nr:MFS transporter [Actinomycetales bacterium]
MSIARWRALASLEASNLVSALSNAMVLLLIPWLVLAKGGSSLDAGVVVAIAALPGVVLIPLAGTLVDRIGARVVAIISDALSALSVILFPIVAAVDLLTLPMLIALATLGAAFDPVGYAARKALIPPVAHRSRVSLAQLNSVHEAVFGAAWVIGPALAGGLIALVGTSAGFIAAGAMFALAGAAMATLRVTSTLMSADERGLGLLAETRDGLRALWRDPLLRVITLAIVVLAGVYLPIEGVLLPTWFESRSEPATLGLILAAAAVGGVVGALAYPWLSARVSTRILFSVCAVGSGVVLLPMAALPPAVPFIALGLLLGLLWGPVNPLLNTLVQTRIPAGMQGRAFGLQTALFSAAPPIGYLVTGVATLTMGVSVVFLIIAVLLIIVGLAATVWVYRIDAAARPEGAAGN